MGNKKNNKGVISLLIVIIIILLVLCVLFARGTISFNSNETTDNDINENVNDNNNNNNNNDNDNILKLDSSKEWVYDADYNLPTNKESYYGYSDHTKLISASDLVLPYINIDSADAKKVNQEIYKLYEDLINKFNENLKEEIWFTLVEYETYTNNNIISVVITTESAGTAPAVYNYYTYSFNLETGKLLSYNEVYKIAGLNEDNILDKATQAVTSALRKKYSSGDDFDTYNNKSINNYKTSVNNDTIKFFIDGNKKLNIIVTLEIPAGSGQFDTVITVE